MSVFFSAKSGEHNEREVTLTRGERAESSCGVIRIDYSEVLLSVGELRELAEVATMIANKIEPS